jgi:hypothetical protein
LFFCWLSGREVFRGVRLGAPLVLLLAASSYAFVERGIQIRADNPMNLLWSAAFFLWFVALGNRSPRTFFLSGAVLGFSLLCSLKALILGVGIGLMFLAAMAIDRKPLWKEMILFGVGTTLGPIVATVGLGAAGNLGAFWESNFVQNIGSSRSFDLDGLVKLFGEDPFWVIGLLLACVYAGIRSRSGAVPRGVLVVLPCAIWMLVQFVFVLPVHYM